MLHGRKKGTKMNNKAYDLASYSFASGEPILVDANIWLYLFPAPGNPRQHFAHQYSSAFSRLVSAQAQPVLDPMVLSEYLNRYCRIEWEGNFKSQYQTFKQFRQSADFGPVVLSAHAFAAKILLLLASSVNSPSRYLHDKNVVRAEMITVITCHQKLSTMKNTVMIPQVLNAVNIHFVKRI